MPVIGGHAGTTILPLLSQVHPIYPIRFMHLSAYAIFVSLLPSLGVSPKPFVNGLPGASSLRS